MSDLREKSLKWSDGGNSSARPLRRFFNGIAAFFKGVTSAYELANEAEELYVGFENAVIGENGRMLIPFGDHKHNKGIQRLDRSAAERIVRFFNEVQKLTTKRVQVYEGHPDHPKIGHKFPNKHPQGYIKSVEILDNENLGDGSRSYLALTPRYGKKAKELLENLSYQFFSPTFLGRPTSERINGLPVLQLEAIKSVGLTNEPNIPVVAIANETEDPSQNQDNEMNIEELRKLLNMDNAATQDEVEAELKKRLASDNKAELEQAKKDKSELENEKTQLSTQLANEKTQRTELEKKLTAERKARSEELVNTAIAAKKLSPSAKDQWLTDLANDATFDAKVAELDNMKPQLPGDSKTQGLGRRKEAASKIGKISELVNEKMATIGGDELTRYDRAYAAVKEQHQELFN